MGSVLCGACFGGRALPMQRWTSFGAFGFVFSEACFGRRVLERVFWDVCFGERVLEGWLVGRVLVDVGGGKLALWGCVG